MIANRVGFQTPTFARVWRRASPTITHHSLSALFASSSSRSSDGHRLSTHDGRGREKLFPNTTAMADDDDESNHVHRKYYSISGAGRLSSAKMETNTGHFLRTDVPRKMGGADSAPQPVEHLLAALIGCTQATAVYVGRMMNPRLIVDGIDFDVAAHRDERGALELPIEKLPTVPARLRRVRGTARVHFEGGVRVSDERLRMLGEQTEARCPIANMMHASGCVMDIQWLNGDGGKS